MNKKTKKDDVKWIRIEDNGNGIRGTCAGGMTLLEILGLLEYAKAVWVQKVSERHNLAPEKDEA